MIDATYDFLNMSDPNITTDCWLCLDARPPYYLGLAIDADLTNLTHSDASRCLRPRVTLGDVRSFKLCLLTHRPDNKPPYHNCSKLYKINGTKSDGDGPYRAPEGAWWACNKGLNNCIYPAQFDSESPDLFCILVYILPQVFVYDGDSGRVHLQHIANPAFKEKRAVPILIPLLIGAGFAGSTAVGASALVLQDTNIKALSAQVSQDLGFLEATIGRLEKQVDSLAEVALQNRRGLDLLFMKEGGLCVALSENFCFYANQSRVVRETPAMIRRNLKDKYYSETQNQNLFQSWFNWSPWLTTLFSAVAGPAIILILLFLAAPCVMQCITTRFNNVMSEARRLYYKNNYYPLRQEDAATS